MTLGDEVANAATELEIERLRGRLDERAREIARLRAHARERDETLHQQQAVLAAIEAVPKRKPTWLKPKRAKARHAATVCSIFSDAHLDEVVRPSEINNMNAYNREIAQQRWERYVNGLVEIPRRYFAGVGFDGLVLFLGGDLVSGNIHDELRETNAGTMAETIAYWVPQLAAGIAHLADEYGPVHVPCVIGNHGRFTRKPRAKLRAVDNADWLIAQLLRQQLAADDRITWDIPDGTDAIVKVYATTFLLTHGDQASGGGGIGGIWPPIKRMAARKLERYRAHGEPFEWLVMGHWHQLIQAQGMVVNGSSKGYDEYAATNNFAPEKPQQAMWLTTPEQGVTMAAPIFVGDPVTEGWRRR